MFSPAFTKVMSMKYIANDTFLVHSPNYAFNLKISLW